MTTRCCMLYCRQAAQTNNLPVLDAQHKHRRTVVENTERESPRLTNNYAHFQPCQPQFQRNFIKTNRNHHCNYCRFGRVGPLQPRQPRNSSTRFATTHKKQPTQNQQNTQTSTKKHGPSPTMLREWRTQAGEGRKWRGHPDERCAGDEGRD